ncbi:hypothetical protein M758_8G158800 [Ceratodon purpureus]|nr:hypothetical protein M758_8G158800 [Ceratodon purpureus]
MQHILSSCALRACSMESLLMRTSLPISRQSFASHSLKGIRKLQEGHRIGADRVVVRARRDGGEEDVTGRFGFGVSEEEGDVGGKRRPLWQRAWGFGGRSLGFGERWQVDPRGQRELEEFDLFLEGKGLDFQWKDVLEPSVENVLALVLTGLFLYAVVLIGWQLLLVAAAITLSALKYAVIAAVVVGVLIFFI